MLGLWLHPMANKINFEKQNLKKGRPIYVIKLLRTSTKQQNKYKLEVFTQNKQIQHELVRMF